MKASAKLLNVNKHIRMISEGPRDTENLALLHKNKLYFKVY